jgi:hypothetical protein
MRKFSMRKFWDRINAPIPVAVFMSYMAVLFGTVFLLLMGWLVTDTVQNNQLMASEGLCGQRVTWSSFAGIPYDIGCFPPPTPAVRIPVRPGDA